MARRKRARNKKRGKEGEGERREERETGGHERAKREGERAPSLSPLPYPILIVVFFSAHISLRCPHDLNAWNRLFSSRPPIPGGED